MTCTHARAEAGEFYHYCPDCGATKRARKPGDTREDPWHSCDLCRLAPRTTNER